MIFASMRDYSMIAAVSYEFRGLYPAERGGRIYDALEKIDRRIY
jgi:hypothetical protein